LKATGADLFVIAAGDTRTFSADLADPVVSAVEPVNGVAVGVSWFTATLPDGTAVPAGVTVLSSEIRTNSFDIVFQNTNGFDVNIDEMEIWGEPAKVVDRIEYTETDDASIEKFEEKLIEINNPFIQSISQCDSLALAILDGYAVFAGRLQIELKGSPAYQLGDVVSVNYRNYVGDYRIVKTYNRIQNGKYTQVLDVRKYTAREWFVLDYSPLDGTAVLTP